MEYPIELTYHPIPLMLVYGLPESAGKDVKDGEHAKGPTESKSVEEGQVEDHKASADGTLKQGASVETSPTVQRRGSTSGPRSKQQQSQSILAAMTMKPSLSLWEAAKFSPSSDQSQSAKGTVAGTVFGLPHFHVRAVPQTYELPPRSSMVNAASAKPPSPLSPKNSQSPLYPDGIITPQWIRKYRDDIPAVAVGFYDLWDATVDPKSAVLPPDSQRVRSPVNPLGSHLEDPEACEHDSRLAHSINQRRKSFQDRGIKFAAVLVISQAHIDDASVDHRIATIRRSCGLDIKNSFFVLPPISTTNEAQEFVSNLFRSVYEPAMSFYSDLIKDVRMKRSKLPSPTIQSRPPINPNHPAAQQAHPLNIQGWLTRYDYKVATWLEFKQDIEGACKGFESAYTYLLDMFQTHSRITPGYPGLLPGSKRWQEARILADCLNCKICRFYVFLDNGSAALSQLNRHLSAFQTLLSTWKSGEDTYDYWAWLSKQYKLFAETMSTAVKHGFKLPPAYNPSIPHPASLARSILSIEPEHGTSTSNPGSLLQHAGFYYHIAAMCSAERRRRFHELQSQLANQTAAVETRDNQVQVHVPPTFETEKAVDHSNVTIELLTKSYEHFKRHKNTRMTLYMAAEIAGSYFEAGKYEMALKFFERIGKTYRKEQWTTVLISILRWSLRCARELGAWDHAIEFLLELLSPRLEMPLPKRLEVQHELVNTLNKNEVSNGTEPQELVFNMEHINPFITCTVQFRKKNFDLGEDVEFQVEFATQRESPPESITFTAMEIVFDIPNLTQRYSHDESHHAVTDSEKRIEFIECGSVSDPNAAEQQQGVNLTFQSDSRKIIGAKLRRKDPGDLTILAVIFLYETKSWNIQCHYDLTQRLHNESEAPARRRWYKVSDDSTTDKPSIRSLLLPGRGEFFRTSIKPSVQNLPMQFERVQHLLLDEIRKVNILIENREEYAIIARLDIHIKGAPSTDNCDFLAVDADAFNNTNVQLTSFANVDLGVIGAGQKVAQHFHVKVCKFPDTRVLEAVLHGRPETAESVNATESETREQAHLPILPAFQIQYQAYPQAVDDADAVSIVTKNHLRYHEDVLLCATIRACADDVIIETTGLNFQSQSPENKNGIHWAIHGKEDTKQALPRTIHRDQSSNSVFLLRGSVENIHRFPPEAISPGCLAILWRRTNETIPAQSFFPLPSLTFYQRYVHAVAHIPKPMQVDQPVHLRYVIHNPLPQMAQLACTMESSDAFCFAGYKHTKVTLLPMSCHTLSLMCWPLVPGQVRLPRLRAEWLGKETREDIQVVAGFGNVLSTQDAKPLVVYVLPKHV
ncbi:hypothetical protein BZG36_00924 [Bifiguratus adelaidae]|uniref:Trafficking protein particle complex subunit 11 domain-containing protein n=1 Tax=Bifiguratus adelaidae TaxID=1938954 RepID=A0A261Y5G1_9FUNG|nr:hypothetical protein BZG36_00924 [Bifiguratus adelaidae]